MGEFLLLVGAVLVLALAAAAGATLGVYAIDRMMEFLWPMRYGRRRRTLTVEELRELYSGVAGILETARSTPPADRPSDTLLMYTAGRAGVTGGPR